MKANMMSNYFSIFLSRLISGFSLIFLSFYIANIFGVSDSGFFNLFWTVLMFFSILSKYGNDYLSLKKIGIYAKNKEEKSSTFFINRTVSFIILICIVVLLLYQSLSYLNFFDLFFDKKEKLAFSFAAYCILPFTLVIFFASILKGFQSKSAAYILDQGGIALSLLLLVFLCEFNIYTDLPYFFWIGSSIILVFLFVNIQSHYSKIFNTSWSFKLYLNKIKDSFRDANSYFFLTFSDFILYWSPIIFISFFNNLFETGVYSNILRLSQIIVFFMAIINTLLAPKLAAELNKKTIDNYKLKEILQYSIRYNIYIGVVIFLFIILVTPLILNFINIDLYKYIWVIVFLYLAQLIKLLNGPTIYFLTMSSNGDVLSYKLARLSLIVSMLLIPFLTSIFGIIGAGISFFLVTLILNLYAAYQLKRNFNILIFSLLR